MLNINEIISQLESLRENSQHETESPGDIWDKDCEALDYAIQAVVEKQEKDKIRCESCQTYNKKLCPISKCYNNDPKNGWKTPFEKKDFCSYFTGGLKNV